MKQVCQLRALKMPIVGQVIVSVACLPYRARQATKTDRLPHQHANDTLFHDKPYWQRPQRRALMASVLYPLTTTARFVVELPRMSR
jgi:hypothetical protein